MAQLATSADTWEGLDSFLGSRDTRKIAHNTYAERDGDTINIRLHSTVILSYSTNGTITLNTGGWRTVTTKDRINAILPAPWRVWSDKGSWRIAYGRSESVSDFYDGMVITGFGEFVTEPREDDGVAMRKVKRQIKAYVALYTDERIAELAERAAEGGARGDCLFCQMGAQITNADHLDLHMAESYTMASLMVNALRHVGYRDHQIAVNLMFGDTVRRAIRRYLTETLTDSHGARPAGRENREGGFAA